MHGLDRVERHDEIARVLYVYDKLRATLRGNLADRTKLLAAVGNKGLKSHLDLLAHDPSLGVAGSPTPAGDFEASPCKPLPRIALERAAHATFA